MENHVLVDITAAMEYAKKLVQQEAVNNAGDAEINDFTVYPDGLAFGFGYYIGDEYGDSGSFNIPIDEFIVKEN